MKIDSPAAMEALGQELAAMLRTGDIVTLEGDLGAGKTTLARGVLAGLGYTQDVSSPSFAIIHSYEPPEVRLPIAHIDFYRLEDKGEWEELGLDEMALHGAMIVEWPEKGPDWIRRDALAVRIEFEGTGARRLTVEPGRAWKDRWQRT